MCDSDTFLIVTQTATEPYPQELRLADRTSLIATIQSHSPM